VAAGLAWVCLPAGTSGAVTGGSAPPRVPPWAAFIALGANSPSGSPICSGALIGDGWVLTAGHCVEDVSPSQMHVLIGEPSGSITSTTGYYDVEKTFTMPGFDLDASGNPPSDIDDAALIELASPHLEDQNAVPLAFQESVVYGPGAVSLFGYGADGTTAQGADLGLGVLRELPAGAFTDAGACAALLCLHRDGSADLGDGDSGAPWVRPMSGQWQLIGVEDVVSGPSASQVTQAGATPTIGHGATPGATDLVNWARSVAGLPVVSPGSLIWDSSQKTAWLVGANGYRSAVASSAAYHCLLAHGHKSVTLPQVLTTTMPQEAGPPVGCRAPS